jgi:hypothetical protein
MRIGVVGGITRNEAQLGEMARIAGHRLESHSGNVHGRGADELRAMVERSELLVILTDVNSHGGVQLARKIANRLGKGALLTRRLGAARFAQLLEALDRRETRQLAVG